MTIKKTELVIFNLSMNLDNPILANTNLWVNEFSKHFTKVHVYSTHIGKYSVPKNVYVKEIGGGSFRKRFLAFVNLTKIMFKLRRLRKNLVVFHHQSPRTAIYPGLFLKFFRIKQGLWYSHSSRPPTLIGGVRIVDYMISSTPDSLPLKSKKSHFLGHGIDTEQAIRIQDKGSLNRKGILFLGRIDRIKKIEECIIAIKESNQVDLQFTLVGPTNPTAEYLSELTTLAQAENVRLNYETPIDHDEVFQKMAKYDMFFAGMKNSVDKSCLEAAACGCLVITADSSSAELSGMKSFWRELLKNDTLPEVSQQIRLIRELDDETLEKLRLKVQRHAISTNSADELVSKISLILKSK